MALAGSACGEAMIGLGAVRRWCRVATATLLAAVLPPCGSASADPGADALRKTIEARYAALDRAEAARDGAAIAAIFAPNFVSVDVGGKTLSAAEVVATELKTPPDAARSVKGTMRSLRRVENRVVVEMQTETRWSEADSHRYALVSRTTDVWVKRGPAWRMARTAVDEFTFFQDGRQLEREARQ